MKEDARKVALALLGIAAVIGALMLVFVAAFPYFYAESGSARYAREHRGEAIVEMAGAAVLIAIAWQFIRRSFSASSWIKVIGIVTVIALLQTATRYQRVPVNSQPIGGNWYVVRVPEPREIDTVYYNLYYKRRGHYRRIADLVGEYEFVSPDCLTYRGLKVVGRPIHAMCGYRLPVDSYDTTIAVTELLSQARASRPFPGIW